MQPNITPWSVIATAGIPSSLTRRTMSGIRLAPSSKEYYVVLWRWTKDMGQFILTDEDTASPPVPGGLSGDRRAREPISYQAIGKRPLCPQWTLCVLGVEETDCYPHVWGFR